MCDGTAYNSSCGICLQQGQSDRFLDCNGDCFGNATIDSCNNCTGGNTNKDANYLMDECGTIVRPLPELVNCGIFSFVIVVVVVAFL